ncbi:MAG: ATP phosphoribosyltransferase regulatory subunit [Clostridia bacterium]|nr:ATP phosphoribosyltransferase regulatory subunit [Clostridia bacterium]
MSIDSTLLKSEEKVILKLRGLYRKYGYTHFKMSKFEEYDLYATNKEFLVSDSVITFTDTSGKLMALKPDVTLSIVKNSADGAGLVNRFYYNENVYRISDKTHHYKEIMQTGLECIGDLTPYHFCEVVRLAAMSLGAISEGSVLNVSHLGVISAALDGQEFGVGRGELLSCIENKNTGGVRALCQQYDIGPARTAFLEALTAAYGEPKEVLATLRAKTKEKKILAALEEFESILALCGRVEGVRLSVDFSLVSDMNYYNGLTFRGYVQGVPTSVLRGGQYDKLMEKMGKTSRAIGFAVYLDLLDRLEKKSDYDVDVLLLVSESTPTDAILKETEALIAKGKTVSVQTKMPEKLRYKQAITLGKESL